MKIIGRRFLAVLPIALLAASDWSFAGETRLVESAASHVVVWDVQRDGEGVRGTIASRSGRMIEGIEVRVRYMFLWDDERNPGPDDPSFTEHYDLGIRLSPGASENFSIHPRRPLPERTDGTFDVSVSVSRFRLVAKSSVRVRASEASAP